MKIGLRAVATLKTYGFMAAGFALAGIVIGAFTAGPAIAQAVRAALVSNVDEPGRIPYQVGLSLSNPINTDCTGTSCLLTGPAVKAGKRLVITNISGRVWEGLPGGSYVQVGVFAKAAGFLTNSMGTALGNVYVYPPLTFQGSIAGSNYFGFNQPVQLVYNAGDLPSAYLKLGAFSPDQNYLEVNFTGYMLDCSAAACAAIEP